MTDDEVMRGFIAAALLMGPVIPVDVQEGNDPLDDYCECYAGSRFGPLTLRLFDYAESVGYVERESIEGYWFVTDKGKEFFANADLPLALHVPESSADDEA